MRNLSQFIQALETRGLLTRIACEVDADQEIAEIHRRVIAAEGPALYFERVKGSRFPVVTNLFGTPERLDLAFGQEPIRFLEELIKTAQTLFPLDLGKMLHLSRLAPRVLKTGIRRHWPLQKPRIRESMLNTVDLNRLPITKSWPEDGGSFLTLPLVYSEDPAGKGHNLGIYRMQRYDDKRLGVHWQIAKGGGYHYHVAEERNAPLPLTVHLGGPPALILSAIAPLPENVGELILASFLLGEKLKVTKLGRHPLPVVAECEFALLGHVPPRERRGEGPFGDHYGYYSLRHDYPVFHCEEIWHARNAVFPATVVGKPRQEDFYIGQYLQRLLSPLFPLVMPGVADLWSYGETGFHALCAAVVKERFSREAMVTAFRILGEGQLALTKVLLVVNRVQDLSNFAQVLEFVLERADFSRDLYVFNHLSMDTLDYTGPEVNKGSKAVFLGIGEPVRSLPVKFQESLPAGLFQAKPFCRGCLVVEAPAFSKEPHLAEKIAHMPCFEKWPLIVLVDDLEKTLHNSASFLWTTFTRFEPAADLTSKSMKAVRHHFHYEPPIVIDARMKPTYPKELFCAPEIQERVSRRWLEYFPRGMAAGSSDKGHL